MPAGVGAAVPVRIGLVGYGFGGRYFHAPLIASAPGCAFVGVVTRSAQRRAELASEHPGAVAFDSLAALAGAGAEAVAISTPAATHVDLVREAVGLGLAVVVDKPFALDAASARATVELAEQSGVLLSVYQNRRWDSDFLTVRRLIADGSIGAITRFESRFERFKPDPGPGAAGGGTLLDFGSHLVDQVLQLFGAPDRVYGEVLARGGGLDDDVFMALRHAGGVHTHLWGSWVQGAPGPRLRVTGTTGTYLVHDVDSQEAALIAGRSPATEGDRWGVEPQSRWGRIERGSASGRIAAEPVRSERGRWDTYYPTFAAAVRGDGQVPVNPSDAVAALEVLERVRASAAVTPALIME